MLHRSKNAKPEPSYFTASRATIDFHTNKENELKLDAIYHHNHHAEESKKKFFLNPQQAYHHKQMKKANENLENHRKNIEQLSISELSGAFKITKSKSGNHSHYQVASLAEAKVPAPQQ